jgi:hypothetical protein
VGVTVEVVDHADCNLSRSGTVTRQEILDRLRTEAPSLRLRFDVKTLAVFGSMARGDDREGSDVDVLVTFEGGTTFDKYFDLKFHLEEILGRTIDLVTPNGLRPTMRPQIEREAVHVA